MYLIKHIILCCLIFTLTGITTFVNASDGWSRLGIRAEFNRSMFSIDREPDFEIGMGFGAGLAAKIPLTNQLSLNPEASLYYRESGVQIYYSSHIDGFHN